MPMLAEITPRPAETNAVRSWHPTDHLDTMLIALGRVSPLLQGLGGYTRGCADAPPWKELHQFEGQNPQLSSRRKNHTKEMKILLLLAYKDYKGLPARSRRKIQTHCHSRGNLFYLGEERAPVRSTESLPDITTRLLGIARSGP